jgi:hypothetical protein
MMCRSLLPAAQPVVAEAVEVQRLPAGFVPGVRPLMLERVADPAYVSEGAGSAGALVRGARFPDVFCEPDMDDDPAAEPDPEPPAAADLRLGETWEPAARVRVTVAPGPPGVPGKPGSPRRPGTPAAPGRAAGAGDDPAGSAVAPGADRLPTP